MRYRFLTLAAIIFALFALGAWLAPTAKSQTPATQAKPQANAQQQAQLDRLKELEAQLQKDRDAVHQAIGQYGFDSNQVDAARAQLLKDRTEYRQLRRSLAAAGLAAPFYGNRRGFRGHMGRRGNFAARQGWMGRGRGMSQCPCRGW